MADSTVTMPWEILDRMERAVERVRERLLRSTNAIQQAGIAYAVVGDHAVASWVATVDEGAVRNSPAIDLLVRREDLPAITGVLQQVGFVLASTGETKFLDGSNGKLREAVHLWFASEKVCKTAALPFPDLATVQNPAGFQVLKLDSLVQMLLIACRNRDRMHIRDLIDVGLLDRTWLAKLPPVLAERLREILDTPES